MQEPDLFAAAAMLAGAYTVTGEDGKITDEYKEKAGSAEKISPSISFMATAIRLWISTKRTNPIFEYLTETVGNPNVIYSRMHDVSYDGRDYYTMHNVEVRVFNHDLMFVNSYDPVTNPKGDEALPADQANRNITPFTWLFAQTQEVIPAPESITLSKNRTSN